MTYDRSPEFDDNRSAERWTETLEAWAARLDTDDADKLDALAVEIEGVCGQAKAWHMTWCFANIVRDGPFWPEFIATARTAARDAILAIEMPEDTDD